MKPLSLFAAVTLWLAAPAMSAAQQSNAAPLARGDISGTVGWLSGNKSEVQSQSSNDWFTHGFYAGAQAGWYWTDHHKTEVEAGLTAPIDFWTYRSTTIDEVIGSGSSLYTFRLRRVAMGQHYHFFENDWVHPHVGAGVDLTWERSVERADPVIAYDQSARMPRVLRPGGTFGPTTRLRVRPYFETGFKAYMTRRAFFRGDLRVLARSRFDEVLLRCGFGVDF